MTKKGIVFISAACVSILTMTLSCDKKVGQPTSSVNSTTTTTTTGSSTTSGSTTGSTTGGTVATGCDTVTYTKNLKKIIDMKCGSGTNPVCHAGSSPSGGVLLVSYSDVKAKGEGGRIKARVFDSPGAPMPPDGAQALTSTEKAMITCWLDKGYKQ